MSSFGLDESGKVVEEWDYLNKFFKRYNKVNIDEMAIAKEKGRLEKENTDLRAILKQYLDGVSVNEDVINNPTNPLVIVNQRLQHTLKARNRQKGPPARVLPCPLATVAKCGAIAIINVYAVPLPWTTLPPPPCLSGWLAGWLPVYQCCCFQGGMSGIGHAAAHACVDCCPCCHRHGNGAAGPACRAACGGQRRAGADVTAMPACS